MQLGGFNLNNNNNNSGGGCQRSGSITAPSLVGPSADSQSLGLGRVGMQSEGSEGPRRGRRRRSRSSCCRRQSQCESESLGQSQGRGQELSHEDSSGELVAIDWSAVLLLLLSLPAQSSEPSVFIPRGLQLSSTSRRERPQDLIGNQEGRAMGRESRRQRVLRHQSARQQSK